MIKVKLNLQILTMSYTRTIIMYESSYKLFQTRDLTKVFRLTLFNKPKKLRCSKFLKSDRGSTKIKP